MKIILAEYNKHWPKVFQQERDILLETLKSSSALIEHIGSTSVPGLLSKPIIDIMIGLPDRRFFKKLVNNSATHHINMTQINSEFWERHLLFRNYLRANPNVAGDYAALKTELAKHDWQDSNDFAVAKTAFVRRIESQARLKNHPDDNR
jgi:GrpB-like predicted nucleotidyltransferase (UPF0157 family)